MEFINPEGRDGVGIQPFTCVCHTTVAHNMARDASGVNPSCHNCFCACFPGNDSNAVANRDLARNRPHL